MPPSRLSPLVRLVALVLLGGAFASALAAAEPAPATKPDVGFSGWDLAEFVDRLPDMLADRLPGFEPTGALRLYVRPRFGDLLRRDYLRVPFGARLKVSENVESSAELQSYFTHGLSDAAGYGFSGLRLGTKCEHVLPSFNDGGISLGVDFLTPLSRPPMELTDGYRHLQPYVTATRALVPEWKLLGYTTLGADLLMHTALPSHFGRNQLHTNSLTLAAGAARQWSRFHTSVTASLTSSAFVSDERRQVFALRPEIVVPVRQSPDARAQVMLTLGGYSVWGPDGNELGLTSSVRIKFALHRSPARK